MALKKEIKAEAKEALEKVQEDIKKLQLEDILSVEQMEIYKKASPQRKIWLECFIRSGEPNESAKVAYPNMSQASIYTLSSTLRQYFKISVADIFRAIGIDEVKIVKKTNQLLDAKRVKRTFIKGDLQEETEEEDNFAIGKGLDIAIKLTGNEPSQKHLIGEDPDNRFKGLADLMKIEKEEKPK